MFGRRCFRLFGSIRLQHAAADQLQQLIFVGHGDIVVAICADGEIGVANPLKVKMGIRFSVIGTPFRLTQKAMQPDEKRGIAFSVCSVLCFKLGIRF